MIIIIKHEITTNIILHEKLPIVWNGLLENNFLKFILKFMFWKRCFCEEVLLPSNDKTGIEFHLLLINKERKITPQLKILLKDYRKFKTTKWNYLGY